MVEIHHLEKSILKALLLYVLVLLGRLGSLLLQLNASDFQFFPLQCELLFLSEKCREDEKACRQCPKGCDSALEITAVVAQVAQKMFAGVLSW
jgi:hypothetical protein